MFPPDLSHKSRLQKEARLSKNNVIQGQPALLCVACNSEMARMSWSLLRTSLHRRVLGQAFYVRLSLTFQQLASHFKKSSWNFHYSPRTLPLLDPSFQCLTLCERIQWKRLEIFPGDRSPGFPREISSMKRISTPRFRSTNKDLGVIPVGFFEFPTRRNSLRQLLVEK